MPTRQNTLTCFDGMPCREVVTTEGIVVYTSVEIDHSSPVH
jgi:hypothetical protein